MASDQPAIRTVEVRPPSVRAETIRVSKALFHVAYWSTFVIFTHAEKATLERDDPSASAFETRFQSLDSRDQRIFRSVSEGMLEAERARSQGGRWPTASDLAAQGIPPFAPDPIDDAGYAWTSLAASGVVNYVGVPADKAARPTFVVIITEPPPGTTPDPNAVVDETHHKLGDGTMIHVSVFTGPGLEDPSAPVAFLAAEAGWRRITTETTPAR